jgi:HlyD family secretion protein
MKVGQPASVTLDALTGKTLAGKISEISDTGTINQGGTTFKVTVDLPADPLLRTGMTATAVITVEKREGVVRIPLEALQETDGEQYVYTGTAVSSTELGDKKTVTTGISDGEYVEILSGLKSGEKLNFYYSTGNDNMFMFGNRPGVTHPQELVPLETTD